MGIRVTQKGAGALASKAGSIVGASQKSKQEQAAKEQEQRDALQAHTRLVEIKARSDIEEASIKWEGEKIKMRSQQEFAQELRDRQYELDRFNRAKEWDIEKITLRSQMDFQREEGKRSESMQEGEVGLKGIDKAIEKGEISGDEDYIQSRRQYFQDKADGVAGPVGLYNIPKEIRTPLGEERRELTNVLGREVADIMDITELRREAAKLGFSTEDLAELGIEDFPGVTGEVPEYEVNQVISTPQGNMQIVGFDEDGEPLVEPTNKEVGNKSFGGSGASGSFTLLGDETIGTKLAGAYVKAEDFLTSKPFAGRRTGTANTGSLVYNPFKRR